MTTALVTLTASLARTLNVSSDAGMAAELLDTMKATVFKGTAEAKPTDAQIMALLVIAQQYRLNPWTKELYAFPDKRNGIVPVVGVDGWTRIINEHPNFDGVEFAVNFDTKGNESVTCTMYRKDRNHPTVVTEYLVECIRGTDPWKSHPRRMLRHKALIQCARVAFGFAGIYDDDEAQRIVEATGPTPAPGPAVEPNAPQATQPPKPLYDQTKFEDNLNRKWRAVIQSKDPALRRTAEQYITWLEEGHTLTEDQRKTLRDCEPNAAATDVEPKATSAPAPAATQAPAATSAPAEAQAADTTGPGPDKAEGSPLSYAEVAHAITHAKTMDDLNAAGDLIRHVPDVDTHRVELQRMFDSAEKTLAKG
jgi:phage recombination protein Bet